MIKMICALGVAIAIVINLTPVHAGDAATQAADNNTATSQNIVIKKKIIIMPPPLSGINQ